MPQTASTSSGILDVIDQRPNIVGLFERPSSAGTAQALVPDARG